MDKEEYIKLAEELNRRIKELNNLLDSLREKKHLLIQRIEDIQDKYSEYLREYEDFNNKSLCHLELFFIEKDIKIRNINKIKMEEILLDSHILDISKETQRMEELLDKINERYGQWNFGQVI